MIPVKYIGKRPEYEDGTYGTRIKFKQGESVLVPDDAAKKMLQHQDQYVPGDVLSASLKESTPLKEFDVDSQDLRDQVEVMPVESLIKKAEVDYGIKLKMDKRMALDRATRDLRDRFIGLVDRFGVV